MLKQSGCLLLAVGALFVFTSRAGAAVAAPGWETTTTSYPTELAPGGSGTIEVAVYNVGAAPSSGTVTVTDTLPPGVTATRAEQLNTYGNRIEWSCKGTTVVTCTNGPGGEASLPIGAFEHIGIFVNVEPGTTGVGSNAVTVAGGGAPSPANASAKIMVGSTHPGFGFADFDGWFSNADGTVDTQAGSHPYEMSIEYHLDSIVDKHGLATETGGELRDIAIKLPRGLVGNPTVVPRCSRAQLDGERCPASTQVGVDTFGWGNVSAYPVQAARLAIYNMVPPAGMPAQFAFNLFGVNISLNASVRDGGDYGITEHVENVAQRNILWNTATIWGVPSESAHDASRIGPGCREGCSSNVSQAPFLTLPTSCDGPRSFATEADTWEPGGSMGAASFLTHDANGVPTGFTGCDHLGFGPTVSVAPDTSFADTPAGLQVEVKASQSGLGGATSLATANLKDTTVVLPQGVVINPGQATGLLTCQPYQDGLTTGVEKAEGRENDGPPKCPSASKVGEDEIETPLLSHALKGNVYVLQSNPPNLKLLVTASGEGVNLKLVGDVQLNEATGQLTTTFNETPELPFTVFKLSFSGGAQAALATPTTCGAYKTGVDFRPWSTAFVPDVLTESSFAITGGTGGGPCPSSPLPFAPMLTAGATTDQAGGYTNFSLLLQRPDDQQRVSTLQFRTPAGLLGMISKVPLCDEASANSGTCPAASQIGHTVVEAGPGPYPLVVPLPGQPPAPIYLTAAYKGAPYGLSIVVPLNVGPFTLQTQVVRAAIIVDPHTAQLTVTTDPLPQIIDGIPTDLRTINAVIDREGFMFNPTNCNPMSFSGSATAAEGANAQLTSHFQVGSCQALKFAPNFKVSTSRRTSRADGASLTAKIVYPTSALGANQASRQSNIASVKVDLPKQLPSRLTTLQKACVAKVFDENPANCPKGSVVGHATAITPVLPVPLNGPAYFVSHGGEAFPSLIVVLQGYGVTIELVGTTFINHAGITSSTFRQVPDVPIASFELVLPQGRSSALAANLPGKAHGSFCGQLLKMPTAFTGQNGAKTHESTRITVTGCAKAKTLKKTRGRQSLFGQPSEKAH